MRIVIGEETEKAMECLNLKTYPFTSEELKTNFRSLMKEYHPDIAKGSKEEAEKKAKEINYSYRLIENLAIDINAISKDKARITKELEKDDMFDFWAKCEHCFGTGRIRRFVYRGHMKRKDITFDPCWRCSGTGKIKIDPFNPVIRKGAIL